MRKTEIEVWIEMFAKSKYKYHDCTSRSITPGNRKICDSCWPADCRC